MAFRGKTAVVTGVSRGIGAAIARAFKEAGARVAGMDLNQASGALDLFVQGDVADPARPERFAEQVIKALARWISRSTTP